MPELLEILEINYEKWREEGQKWLPHARNSNLDLRKGSEGQVLNNPAISGIKTDGPRKGSEGSALKALPSPKLKRSATEKVHMSSPVLSGNCLAEEPADMPGEKAHE